MKFKNLYRSYLDNLITVAKIMVNNQDTQKAFNLISSYINTDKKIFICGNGGSAHTANHFVTDWVKMLNVKKKKKINVFSLNSEIGTITAYANDLAYDKIFSEQLKSYSKKNDLIILISTSGNSKNLISAAKTAKKENLKIIGFLGCNGGKLKNLCDISIVVNSDDIQILEDFHLILGHIFMKSLLER